MSLFSDNIRHLRLKKDVSQEIIAEKLAISRDSLSKYEQGKSQPPHEILIKISRYYHVSIDLLLTVDIRKVDMEGLIKLDDNRIVLPITVDYEGRSIIEIVPHKAKAGYLAGYGDPEFIEGLQHMSLPFLGEGTFRAIAIDGDSMPPYRDSSLIVGKYLEDRKSIKTGNTYIFLTKNEGIVYKRVAAVLEDSLILNSDNSFYAPYKVYLVDILEIWEFVLSMDTKAFRPEDISSEGIRDLLLEIRSDVKKLHYK
ncbi:XRE family transcriptional regulator [Flavobacterium psychrophilum]|nr:XRE family transcriptional regulator [Flavobacterium psychrophilum]AOE53773.1 XRE family transcriptional regulator [Flavobacterium psychrophilum]